VTRARVLRIGLLACVVVGLAWVRQLPLHVGLVELSDPELARVLAEQDDEIRYLAPDGRQHVYLGKLDSYLWLRSARNLIDRGTPCDAIVEGACRDTLSHAPVGRDMFYARALHPRAIAALHRLIAAFAPDFPLPSTAFWVQVLLGAACALPAFGIGRALAGDVGGFAAALVVGLNPIFLDRSIGGDNDVWQVLLPLCMVWAAVRAFFSENTAGAVAFAAVAGLFAGLHAGDWSGWIFAWGALLCGLVAAALLQAVVQRRGRGALIAGVFYVTAGLAAAVADAQEPYLTAPLDILGRVAGAVLDRHPVPPLGEEGITWPDNFAYVQEIRVADLETILSAMGGATLAAIGALGLLLLAVPQLAPRRKPPPEGPSIGPEVVVAVWFVAAFAAAFDGHRWSLLLAAPFGLAFGVAVGRLYQGVHAGTRGQSGGVRWTLRGAALLAALGLLLVPIRNGVALASGITPRMNDAWWEALSYIRETAPEEAVVTTPWDFGYWAAYVAERRVTADGGSLRTQLPYWIARVLVAPSDREATGLLRMLACGSDARPFPEGAQGAYSKLRAAGVSGADAVDWIGELAWLDRGGAESLLAERGLEPDVATEVLASTHCTPPPAYLILSTRIMRGTAWLHLGGWDLREGVAGALGPRFPSWVRCRPEPGGGLACPTRDALLEPGAGGGTVPVARIVWDPNDPFAEPLRLGAAGSEFLERGKPALLLVAGADETDRIVFGSPTHPELALLLDTERERYFLGSPQLIHSTYVRLMLRGAPGSERFEKVFERRVEMGERVAVWRVRWPGDR